MSEVKWLDRLRLDASSAAAHVESLFLRLQSDQTTLSRALDRAVVKVDTTAARRDASIASAVRAEVLELMQRGWIAQLSIRQQRIAASMFDQVPPQAMQELVTTFPSNWLAFARACFRRWEQFDAVKDRRTYTRVLALAPTMVAFLHRARPQDLASERGPELAARLIKASDLPTARVALADLGFDSTWQFSAIALARWVRHRVDEGMAVEAALQGTVADSLAEAMLLPPRASSNRSWFRDQPRPARVRHSVTASAVFVAASLRAAYQRGSNADVWNAFIEQLVGSEYGDPRSPVESIGWARVRNEDPEVHRMFLELMIADDLTVFFEHAMREKPRKVFWLAYLGSVRRTVSVLSRATHDRLKREFSGADKKFASALLRARQFSGTTSGVEAFCLYFDRIVVVEFSRTGNAAQIYERGYFERTFADAINRNQIRDPGDLKIPMSRRGRPPDLGQINHVTEWQETARGQLAQFGIYPDRRVSRR